jgi:hypothetical protein
MKIKVFTILIFLSTSIFGQQTEEWMKMLENPKYDSYELEKENLKNDFLKYDFSTLMVPRQEFLGYIGSDYRRIKIFFSSVVKDSSNEDTYEIKGISLVGNNKCDFSGTIKISQVRTYKIMHFGLDNKYENRGLKSQGVLIGDYEFEENPNQNHSGIFKGVMTLNWYLDKFEILHYDNIECYSDNYKNNQYIGTWSEYNSNSYKICNWGEMRIPFSGDLDIGAAEFSPNSKYFDKGWEDLKIE